MTMQRRAQLVSVHDSRWGMLYYGPCPFPSPMTCARTSPPPFNGWLHSPLCRWSPRPLPDIGPRATCSPLPALQCVMGDKDAEDCNSIGVLACVIRFPLLRIPVLPCTWPVELCRGAGVFRRGSIASCAPMILLSWMDANGSSDAVDVYPRPRPVYGPGWCFGFQTCTDAVREGASASRAAEWSLAPPTLLRERSMALPAMVVR